MFVDLANRYFFEIRYFKKFFKLLLVRILFLIHHKQK